MIRQFIISLFFLFFFFPAIAQVNDGVYKASKMEKGRELPEIVQMKVLSLGNGITIYTEEESKKPLDGTYHFEIYGNRRHIIGNFSKGLAQGEWKEYMYSDLYRTYNFKNGQLDGKNYTLHNDGSNRDISTYKDGIIQHYISYHANKQVEEEVFFDEEGSKHGKVISYNKDGEVVQEANYSHGLYHGPKISLNSNGSKEIEPYNNGVYEGEYTQFYPNGNKQKNGSYIKDHKKEGKWTYWYENGDIEMEENYLKGKLQGEKRAYYPGGMPKYIEQYTDDKLNGSKINYDEESNSIVSEATYVNGELDGEFKAYNNGVLWRESLYKNGKMLREKEYKNGKLNVLRLIDDTGRMVDVQQYNAAGQISHKNKEYRKPASIRLKEDASGIIDIE